MNIVTKAKGKGKSDV